MVFATHLVLVPSSVGWPIRNGLDSAKSQVIGSACMRNAPVTLSLLGDAFQVARLVKLPAIRLRANPRYVATASAYAEAAPSALIWMRASATRLLKVVSAFS